MTHAGEERFVPDTGERSIKKRGLARRVGRTGLLCLVFCMQAVGSVSAVQAGTVAAPILAAPPSSGSTDGVAPETTLTFPLPKEGLDNTSTSQTMPASGSLPPNTSEGRLPSDEELVASGAVIGEVVIRNENIFDLADPRENNWLFRLANNLHAKTRPWMIRKQLLFRTGDVYDKRVLAESERILRSNRYFYDARIRPVALQRDGSPAGGRAGGETQDR